MTQLYASTSNTKKAKSSKFDFLLDLKRPLSFSGFFVFVDMCHDHWTPTQAFLEKSATVFRMFTWSTSWNVGQSTNFLTETNRHSSNGPKPISGGAKRLPFCRRQTFGLTGEVGACQSDDWLRTNNLCLCSGVLSPFTWRGRLICIFHKKGARKIGPLFYWYVFTLFAVAHEL